MTIFKRNLAIGRDIRRDNLNILTAHFIVFNIFIYNYLNFEKSFQGDFRKGRCRSVRDSGKHGRIVRIDDMLMIQSGDIFV
jgi:hypothetical protein